MGSSVNCVGLSESNWVAVSEAICVLPRDASWVELKAASALVLMALKAAGVRAISWSAENSAI